MKPMRPFKLVKQTTPLLLIFLIGSCQPEPPQYGEKVADQVATTDTVTLQTEENPKIESFQEDFFEAMVEEEIQAYHSMELEEAKPGEKIEDEFSFTEVVEIIPYPDEPDETVDSVITTQLDPKTITSYGLIHQVKLNEEGKYHVDVDGWAPRFRPIAEGRELKERSLAYLDWDDTKDHFGESTLRDFIFNLSSYSGEDKAMLTSNPVSPHHIPAFADSDMLINLNEEILEGAREEKLPIYENPLFEEALEGEEIEEKLQREEVVEVAPDPDDPYYTVDSVVVSDLGQEEANHKFVYSWTFTEENFPEIRVKGVAIGVRGERAFLSFEDLDDFLSEEDFNDFRRLLIIANRTEEKLDLK